MTIAAHLASDEAVLGPARELRWAGMALVVFGLVGAPVLGLVELPVAAVAPGKIVSEGLRKPVQHLEGGIVKTVLVREGDLVEAGQVLLQLDETRPRASSTSLLQRYIYLAALQERLAAEETRASSLAFPPGLVARARQGQAEHLLDAQLELFAGRRRSLEERLNGLSGELAQLRQQGASLDEQARSVRRQIDLSQEELADYRRLFDQGYGLKVKVLDLERRIEALRAAAAEAGSGRAAVEARIQQLGLDRSRMLQEYADAAASRRTEIRPELADIEQRLLVAGDMLERGEVRAPTGGTVYNLKRMGTGSVISPGETVLEIVPREAELIAEVQIDPADIETVRSGDKAFVRVFSRASNRTLEVDGTVTMVSPDRFEDQATRRPYYTAHVVLDRKAAKDAVLAELRAGMPVEGHIVTGQRTPFSLIAGPIVDNLATTIRMR